MAQSWSIVERIGVAHASQVIILDVSPAVNPATQKLMNLAGPTEVYYQALSSNNQIAVLLSLSAGQTVNLELQSGAPTATAPANKVEAGTHTSTYWEYHNTRIGVRVPKTASTADPARAPIQGFRLKSGTWTMLDSTLEGTNGVYNYSKSASITTTFLETGALRTQFLVTYGGMTLPDAPDAGNPGSYSCKITLDADRPSVLIVEDATTDIRYHLFFADGVNADEAHYRGHHSDSNVNGYEPGSAEPHSNYLAPHERATVDALVSVNTRSGVAITGATNASPIVITSAAHRLETGHVVEITGVGGNTAANGTWTITRVGANTFSLNGSTGNGAYTSGGTWSCDSRTYVPMAIYDPYLINWGWNSVFYATSGGASSDAIGAFAGPASLAIGAETDTKSGVRLFAATGPNLQLQVVLERGVSAPFATRNRFAWGLYSEAKSVAVVDPTITPQPVAVEQAKHAGVLGLTEYHNLASATYSDPAGGYGSLWMPAAEVAAIRSLVASDLSYYNALKAAETTAEGQALLDWWRGVTTYTAVRDLVYARGDSVVTDFSAGDGPYDWDYEFYLLGVLADRHAPLINELLADASPTAGEKNKIRAIAAVYGGITWDDDHIPFQAEWNGLNLGLQNQQIEAKAARETWVGLTPNAPGMAARQSGFQSRVQEMIDVIINSAGANIGNPSAYISSASDQPLTLTLAAKQRLGVDFFTQAKLRRFAELVMQTYTPPEPRFGGVDRKILSSGDGNTTTVEAGHLPGLLATGFRGTDNTLASRLLSAWQKAGSCHNGFFSTSLLKINDQGATQSPALGSDWWDGYWAVMRSAYDTANETAVWFTNGAFYSSQGHRQNDPGNLAIYALKTPLSIDWGGYSSISTGGSVMHATVLPTGILTWSSGASVGTTDGGTTVEGGSWPTATHNEFCAFSNTLSGYDSTTFSNGSPTWTREVLQIYHTPSLPIIFIRDSFSGGTAEKIWQMPFMARGNVTVPGGGSYTPSSTTHPTGPTLGTISTFNGANPANFRFTGGWQNSGGDTGVIDWDVWAQTGATVDFAIQSWGHGVTASREAGEYNTANGVTFEERQQTFRFKGAGPFNVFIIPYAKGARPSDLNVTLSGSDLIVTANSRTTKVGPKYWSHASATQNILTALGPTSTTDLGMTVSGGPAEMVHTPSPKSVVVSAHGASGTRSLTLPAGTVWSPSRSPIGLSGVPGTSWSLAYSGGDPVSATFVEFVDDHAWYQAGLRRMARRKRRKATV